MNPPPLLVFLLGEFMSLIILCYCFLADDWPKNEREFYTLLNVFVGKYEQQYYPLLRWNDTDPYNYRVLEVKHLLG